MRVDLDWQGDKVARHQRDGAAKGLRLAAEHVLGVSGDRVPHQEGTLQRSGGYDVDGDEQRASVYYDTPYAVAQHEDLTMRHDNGRQAKYLETAFTDEQDTVQGIIAQALRSELGG